MLKRIRGYFTKSEILLWSVSSALVLVSFLLFDRKNCLILSASLIGVTYLIFNSKGNPVGQVLVIIFSLLYGIISFNFSYYGEMITYLGMTTPMAVLALVSWLKNPYKGNRAEVTIGSIGKAETVFMLLAASAVTVIFYFILKAFHTANLIPGTLSVTTSFIAVYLSLLCIRHIITWQRASALSYDFSVCVPCNRAFLLAIKIKIIQSPSPPPSNQSCTHRSGRSAPSRVFLPP